ncbi:MAG: hypothetical protein F6K10_22785 [Moorea sp. SIO2B7]|nr:hypothetical protein [Moorena sp. SIO2B7]
MANFIILIDPVSERRTQYIDKIKPLLAIVENLNSDSCSTQDFCAIWAANAKAPITSYSDDKEAAAIWGEAITQADSTRINATQLKDLWNQTNDKDLTPFNGFYAAVTYHTTIGLTVGADILGLFPIYYWSHRDVILVGSSPELFRYHPLFEAKFNPVGLVGILLTNGLFDGQTLWQNVRRLNPGHLLTWQPNSETKEVEQYRVADLTSKQYSQYEFLEQLELLDQVLDQSLSSQLKNEPECSLMLSGGLDSRLLAGIIHRQGVNPLAITLGKDGDLEMKCAKSVARTLGYKHQMIDIPFERYLANANLLVQAEHLANGFNNIMDWGLYSHLRNFPPKVVTGYLMDRVVGGSQRDLPSPEKFSFEIFFKNVNFWGFEPKLLESLLRKEVFGDLIPETLARIRTVYESYSEREFRRAWWFEIFHSNRFHVGSNAWRVCFGSWPALPALNYQLLATIAGLSDETIAKRRGEEEFLIRKFPQLAQLPLDRTSKFSIEPLITSQTHQLFAPLLSLQSKWRQLQRKLGWERRYWFRIYDLNNPGWLAVRQQAEPYRQQVYHLFDEEAFNALLPKPEVSIPIKKGRDSLKSLIGFLLWSGDNL